MSARTGRRLRRRDEAGYAAILTALVAATLLVPLSAISVDVARWYVEVERVQNAADAAAMAGVTFLPDDFAAAESTALAVTSRNGYPDDADTDVEVEVGTKPTQLKVTISSTVANGFGAAIGSPFAEITRHAVADYNGPAPMGSPCNAFGNEPAPGAAETTYPGSQLVVPAGGAACTSTPLFWGAIAGPNTPKGNGDAVMTRSCASGTSGCSGTTNDEFDPLGYFYIVRVGTSAVGQPVTIQVYDPAFVETGDTCEEAPDDTDSPSGTTLRNSMNPFTADGLTRYAKTSGAFCTGDVLTSTSSEAPVTSFALRAPTDTYRPVNGTPISGCVKQYKGYREDETPSSSGPRDVTSSRLRQTRNDGSPNTSYRAELAQVFHQWVTLCTFTPTSAGDHYLQVRTNVPLGGTADGNGGYQGNAGVHTQLGDDLSVQGNGNNRFALRVVGPARSAVSVAGWEHMGIYANYPGGTTTFNLVRVIPAAASKNLLISFFDVGDASEAGTITVLPPLDSNLTSPLSGCTGAGVKSGSLPGCLVDNVSSGTGWNGKSQTIKVPVPNTYTCNSGETGGCWFRLQVAFPSGVTDTTTWSARVEGDPIRLIE
jgi:Flp pilus assembly protein TadG